MTDYFDYIQQLMEEGQKQRQEPLDGLRVLDLTRVIFGPSITKWLGLFGAEVIKVEEPDEGDMWRIASAYWAQYWKESSINFQSINYNKHFIAVDLRNKKGKEIVLELAKTSDVVIENYRAGLMEAWGLGYTTLREVNPKIIYVSCSGYGQWGPMRFFPSYDIVAQSITGCATLTGFPGQQPYKLPDFFGDYLPGLAGVTGLMAALNHCERTGEGQFIDMAQAEGLMRFMPNWPHISCTGDDIGRTGNTDPCMAPSGIFRSADNVYVAIGIASDEQFSALLKAMQREDLASREEYKEALSRLKPENAAQLNSLVQEWVETKDAGTIIDEAKDLGWPAAVLMDDLQLVNDSWRRQRGSVIEFKDSMYDNATLPVLPAAFSKTPARVKWMGRPVGYHNRQILRKYLGYSRDRIHELEKEGVIGYWDNRVSLRPPLYYDITQDSVFLDNAGDSDENRSR